MIVAAIIIIKVQRGSAVDEQQLQEISPARLIIFKGVMHVNKWRTR